MSWIQTYRNRRVDSGSEGGRRPSIVSSGRASLTPSEIERSVFDIKGPRTACQQICSTDTAYMVVTNDTDVVSRMVIADVTVPVMNRNNVIFTAVLDCFVDHPTTKSGKIKQMIKLISIIMIPVIVLTGITTNTFCLTLSNYAKSSAITNTLLYSVRLGQVIHSLQEERDVSALYLSSIQKKTKNLLLEQYVKTDTSLENFKFSTTGPVLISNEFQSKDNFLSFLNKHRYELDIQDQTVDRELQFYTTLIRVFIVWLYEAVTEDQSTIVWPSLVAYQEVVLAKEYVGLERALGTVFYVDGRFPSLDMYLWFAESQDVAMATILSARRYSDLVHDLYEKNIYKNVKQLENLESMREEIRSDKLGGNGTLNMAQMWFDNMTQYMDLLLVIQEELAIEITKMQDRGQNTDRQKMYVISAVCICVIIISIIIIYVMYFLTNISQRYSLCLAERMYSVTKQKKHTVKLMYQLLPKYIADLMQQPQQDEDTAKNFPDVTVFFSDIQDFTEISSRSAPVLVIQMINKMCTIFDDIIKQNNVHKIETIGDSYLITSGVPSPCEGHAAEICRMSLQLLTKMKSIAIPHLPGQMYKLRIGCHTGPVTAVIAGSEMPRYCLLGETVTIASRIKALGDPGRVHISETTFSALPESDDFKVVERFDSTVKEELEAMTDINGHTRTFWLDDKVTLPDSPSSSSG